MTKRLLLFGATGATGRHVLRLALEDGLQVRAYLRSPQKLPEALAKHEALEVVQGDFANTDAVTAALAKVDVVVCVAGNPAQSKQQPLMLGLTKAIVAGMRTHGVKRFVYQAGAFSPAPGTKNPFLVRTLLRPLVGTIMGISGTLADNDTVMAYLDEQARDLDWTVTRPGMLIEQPSKGALRVSAMFSTSSHFVDLARFTLDTVCSDAEIHAFCYVSY